MVAFLEPTQQESPGLEHKSLWTSRQLWLLLFWALDKSREWGSASGLRGSLFYAANVTAKPTHVLEATCPACKGNRVSSSWGECLQRWPSEETLSLWNALSVTDISDFPSWEQKHPGQAALDFWHWKAGPYHTFQTILLYDEECSCSKMGVDEGNSARSGAFKLSNSPLPL